MVEIQILNGGNMDSNQWNAAANMCVTAVLLLGSFLQMLARANEFKTETPTAVVVKTTGPQHIAEWLNTAGSVVLAVGAFVAYLAAAGGVFLAGNTPNPIVLVLALVSATVVLFTIVMIVMLWLGRLDKPVSANANHDDTKAPRSRPSEDSEAVIK